MRILVCGSRDWPDADMIRHILEQQPAGSVIVHGGARGADQMGGNIAKGLGFAVEEYPADWQRNGRAAGYMRNKQMVDSKPDLVLAFSYRSSKGTAHTIDLARQAGIKARVFTI